LKDIIMTKIGSPTEISRSGEIAYEMTTSRIRIVTYWIATGIIAAEFAIGGALDIIQFAPFLALLQHLGYPRYFSIIVGVWKILGAVTVLAPRFPRLKEWAYAGMFFNMIGAAVSHISAGDSVVMLIAPLTFTLLIVVSWYLRPASRREITSPVSIMNKKRTIIYWFATAILAVECFVGGVMGALRVQPFLTILNRLGYPAYLMTMLGVSYILAGGAILLPRYVRAKEWAYAGLIFIYTVASASRIIAGDGIAGFGPLIFCVLVVVSWALRPTDRSVPKSE
jgi:uncharacterized membrane protein YphA (DoxX/SURF4 family)